MEFKEALRWTPDAKPMTTDAVVLVSSCGIVKVAEYTRWNALNKSYNTMKEKVRRPSMRGNYLRVSINNKGYAVHRLVAMAWLNNKRGVKQVNHKDGNKLNNNIENLEWCTGSENQKHAMSIGLRKPMVGEDCPASKLTLNQVVEIKALFDTHTPNEIAAMFFVSPFTIRDIKRGTTWRSVK